MKYKIDERKYQERKKKNIVLGYVRLGIGYLFFGYIIFREFPMDLAYKIIFFISLGIIGYFIDKALLKQTEKSIITFEVELNENSIIRYQQEKKIDEIELKNIESVNRIKKGLLVKSKTKKKLFIPDIIESIDEIENHLKLKL